MGGEVGCVWVLGCVCGGGEELGYNGIVGSSSHGAGLDTTCTRGWVVVGWLGWIGWVWGCQGVWMGRYNIRMDTGSELAEVII